MKYLICCLAIFSASTLFAQKFEVGANGGVLLQTNFITASNKGTPSTRILMETPTLSVKGLYNFKHWQAGVALDFMRWNYPPYYASGTPVRFANPAVPIQLFANRKLLLKRAIPYAGVFAAAIPYFSPKDGYFRNSKQSGLAYSGGVQLGIGNKIIAHWGFNAEVKTGLVWLNAFSVPAYMYTMSLTVGACYAF